MEGWTDGWVDAWMEGGNLMHGSESKPTNNRNNNTVDQQDEQLR